MTQPSREAEDKLFKLQEKYEKIIAEDPASVAFIFLAQLLIKRGLEDEAMQVLQTGLRHNNQNITGRFLLGKLYYERWLIDPAKKELEQVIELAPDNIGASKILIDIYFSESDIDKVKAVLEKAQQHHPDDTELTEFWEKANMMSSVDQSSEDTGAVYTSADNPFVAPTGKAEEKEIETETMADLCIRQGQIEQAITILEKLLIKEPDNRRIIRKLNDLRPGYSSSESVPDPGE